MNARVGLVLLLGGLLATSARAALPVVPAVRVLVRMLSYDRALSTRVKTDVRVAIVFDAHDPPAFMNAVAEIAGRAVMPPKWSLGYMQSHRTLRDENQLAEIAASRTETIEAGTLVLAGGAQVVEIDGRERAIADPLHANGVGRDEAAPGRERCRPRKTEVTGDEELGKPSPFGRCQHRRQCIGVAVDVGNAQKPHGHEDSSPIAFRRRNKKGLGRRRMQARALCVARRLIR